MAGGDINAAEVLMAARRLEDQQALQRLGFFGEHLGLVDAGFRGEGGPHFPDLASLLCGHSGPGGAALIEQAVNALRERLHLASLVIAPMGIGGHVDHVITRLACEMVVPRHQLVYYADMPYARSPWRWTAASWRQALASRRSWRWISARKRHALGAYASQLPLLFKRSPRYPELLLRWPEPPAAL